MKKLTILLVVTIMVILGLIGVFYWQSTRNPRYSLLQVQKAINQNDLVNFKKYVDIEGISNSLIDQALKMAAEQEQSEDEWEQLGDAIARGFIELLKPRLSELIQLQIVKLVETGEHEFREQTTDPGDPEVSISDIWDKAEGDKAVFQGIEYIKREGKIAYVGLKFFYEEYDADLILDLKMRDMGSYWQIAEFSNLAEFLKKIDQHETQRIYQLNVPIIEEIKKTLVLEDLEKSTMSDEWGISKKVIFKLKFRNEGQKEIDEYRALLTCYSLDGKKLKRLSILDNDNILPGKTGGGIWTTEVNMFLANDNLIFDTPQSELKIDVEIQYVRFRDGSELELLTKE